MGSTLPRSSTRRLGWAGATLGTQLLAGYVLVSYVLLPAFWKLDASRRPYRRIPSATQTAEGLAGDPLNVGLVGRQEELIQAMLAAGWHPADPITLATSLRITESVVLHRPYLTAPVSHLYLFGRREDLAFEQPVGRDARQRHHVRFWRIENARTARPLWVGAATFDVGVGLSGTTGQITHHIAPEIDTERDKLLRDLERAGRMQAVQRLAGFHTHREGNNGGGDPWRTDGDLLLGVLAPGEASSPIIPN